MQTIIGLIQVSCSDNQNDNFEKIREYSYMAANAGARIISLQELAPTRYFAQKQNIDNFRFAEDEKGPSLKMARELSQKLSVYLLLPYFEKDKTAYYNTVAVFNPEGKIIGKYRKMHIPQNILYEEKFYFKPGNLGFPLFKTEFGNFGISICWDHWFPEVQRIYGLKDADIVFSPTAIGYSNVSGCCFQRKHKDIWLTMLKGQAITGGFYFAIINRTGKEDNIDFMGSSSVISPSGKVINSLGENENNCLVQEVDINAARNFKERLQFNRDRCINNAYQELMK
ncbi:MAG: hypothetical protein K9L78_02585 [Victivallales bacterium]|nr:hypothetical protein [Victivallales bacterium]MCF7888983.1 hypothetical protein [Victivallales bacterium]